MEFIVLTIVSIIVIIFIVRFALYSRKPNPTNNLRNIGVLIILAIISMFLGKYGANWGLPWWIYYPIPMLLTLFFPTIYFKMGKKETIRYLALTFISAPLIHIVFSLLGWKNYMPVITVPSIKELISFIIL